LLILVQIYFKASNKASTRFKIRQNLQNPRNKRGFIVAKSSLIVAKSSPLFVLNLFKLSSYVGGKESIKTFN